MTPEDTLNWTAICRDYFHFFCKKGKPFQTNVCNGYYNEKSIIMPAFVEQLQCLECLKVGGEYF